MAKIRIAKRRLNRSLGGDISIGIFLALFGVVMALPMVYAITTSLKPADELWVYPPRFFVSNPTFKNFTDLFRILDSSTVPFSRYLFNTVFVSVVGTGGHVLLSSMCAYAICKFKFKGRNFIFQLVVLSLMFNTTVTIKNKLTQRGAYYSEKALAVSKNWQFMTTLYNTKLAPIAGMASDNTKLSAHSGMNIAGVMWYQGESNIKYAESNGKNTYYTAALNQLIDDWSVIFGFEKGKMPFIFAHIAPCDYSSVRTADYDSAVAQLSAAMNESWAAHKDNTIQIPIYDLPLDYTLPAGYANQAIHPWQKQPVADRFAATILGKFYGGNTGYDAPVYKSSTVSGNTIRITMDNIGTGLKVGSGNTKLFGFTICGADHKFVNADATLSGNTIIVSSPFVTSPVAAAYGFNTFNTNANLYNSYDLPAVPFYTAEFSNAVYLGDHDDWMSCDYSTVWRDNGIVTGDFVDTWKVSNTTGSTVTFDTANKRSGNSSVKVVTTSANRGAAPVLKPSAVTAYRQHFGDYKYLSVYVKNGGASAITLRLQVGSACYATAVGGSGAAHTIPAGSGFTKYTFDISNLLTSNGSAATATQISNAFAQNTISFTADESGSTFYLDDIYLGS